MNSRSTVLALALGCVIATAATAKETVILGVNEGSTKGQMEREMAAVVSHVNTSPNIIVKLKVYPSHDALYEALRNDQVDLAFVGPVKYVQAHYEIGAIALVYEGGSVRGAIAVPSGSPIHTVEELRGKRFAFGYQDSTTTHLIPALLLSKHGLKESDMKVTFAGHQPQKTVDDMVAGKYDACGVSDFVYEHNVKRIRLLEQSDPFAGPPIVSRKALPNAVQDEVRRMFLSYKPPADAVTQHFGKGATPTSDADYNRIRFLCKVLFNKMYQ
jgi:phosphonate transport system substrate-binding protein